MEVYRMINIIRDIDKIENIDRVVDLVKNQMIQIGGDTCEDRIRKSLTKALSPSTRSVIFLLCEDDVYKGFAFANIASGLESGGDYLWINEIFIDDDFRNKGLASKIMYRIEEWSKESDIGYIACSTGMANIRAVNLYKNKGYSVEPTLWVDKKL